MLSRLLVKSFSRYIALFSKNTSVMDKAKDFPAYRDFDSNWEAIKSEMESYILNNWNALPSFDDIDENQKDLIENDHHQWKVLVLKMYGQCLNSHVSPTLAALLKKYDHSISSAIFSCMEAKKHIPAHTGPNKAILRYTLPLKVPSQGEAYLIVDGKKLSLKVGEGILWDDTYLHEAVNASDQVRIALLLDIKRKMPKHVDWVYEFVLKVGRKTKLFREAIEAATVK